QQRHGMVAGRPQPPEPVLDPIGAEEDRVVLGRLAGDRVPDLLQTGGVEEERILLDVELVVPLDELRAEGRREGKGRYGEQQTRAEPGAGGTSGPARRGRWRGRRPAASAGASASPAGQPLRSTLTSSPWRS